MGTVFNRGTKDAPNSTPSQQPTKALAKRFVQEIESRIARGQVGIEPRGRAGLQAGVRSLLEGLTNRNAADDRSRGRRHVVPAFERQLLAEIDLAAVMGGSTSNAPRVR